MELLVFLLRRLLLGLGYLGAAVLMAVGVTSLFMPGGSGYLIAVLFGMAAVAVYPGFWRGRFAGRPAGAPVAVKPTAGEVLDPVALGRMAGLCEGILADDAVDKVEADFLASWFTRDARYRQDERSRPVVVAVMRAMSDETLTLQEASDLRTVLSEFCDSVLGLSRPRAVVSGPPKVLGGPSSPARPTESTAAIPPRVIPAASPPAKTRRATTSLWAEAVPAPGHYEISYTDAKGDVSERRIKLIKCSSRDGVVYLHAFCLSAHAYRTFRADRVTEATSLDTGEWIADPDGYFSAIA